MDNSNTIHTDSQEQQKKFIETYRKKRKISWWINAAGWWILGLGVMTYAVSESKFWFCFGLAAGVGLIISGIVYDIVNKLYKCPYCDGFLLRKTKCMSCGRIVTVTPSRQIS